MSNDTEVVAPEKMPEQRRKQVSQSDVPSYSLTEALRVPQAIVDNYAKQPTSPLDIAKALNMSPTSGGFRMLVGASAAYGLTAGSAWASAISLEDIGARAIAPMLEGDDISARREAVLKPRVYREFLTKYNNAKLPPENIALNVLEQLGVPRTGCLRALRQMLEDVRALGLLDEIKDQQYVRLSPARTSPTIPPADPLDTPQDESAIHQVGLDGPVGRDAKRIKRVFVTHGSNKDIVTQIKELLTFGNYDPVVSVETETLAKPVPEKVLQEMRSCQAGIVHVGTELRVIDQGGEEHVMLNPNVLIEIGAAMALYEGRFILLVEKGVEVPSNLQGLYQVRYEGESLDYEATMKLLKAFNEFTKE
ncbi:MAG: TIR domain-containing protein [Dehalococcoidia bacterium]